MPVVYVHGVNVRFNTQYTYDEEVRDELIQRLLIRPRGKKFPAYQNLKPINPYWGDDGVKFRWNQASVPHVGLEALGDEDFEDSPLAEVHWQLVLHGQ